MRSFQISCLRLATVALCMGPVLGQLTCVGTTSTYDQWCDSNCNAVPSYCPSSFCTCSGAVTPPAPLTCTGVGTLSGSSGDAWCTTSCNSPVPYCPSNFCLCGATFPSAGPDNLDVQPNDPTCCAEDEEVLFFNSAAQILRKVGNNAPTVCYNIDGAGVTDIVIDSNGDLYFANPGTGSVYRGSTDCDASTLEILTSWHADQMVDRPTALAILEGEGLLISGTNGLYLMTFALDSSVDEIVQAGNVDFAIRSIEVRGNLLYIIKNEGDVLILDRTTGVISTYLAVHQLDIPDYGGIAITECGLFFSATDSNRVFFCSDLDDSNTCELMCDPDSTLDNFSCVFANQPTDIAAGCCCDIYVANPGTGCIVRYRNAGAGNPGFSSNPGPWDAEIVTCGLIVPQSVVFYNPPRTGTCTNLCDSPPPPASGTSSPSPSPSPSASPSPSPSSTASPSPSPSTTASSSPSASPSASPSTPAAPTLDARLVFGVNLQASGGATLSSVITGQWTFQLIVCPEGVAASEPTCFGSADRTYNIPLTFLDIVSQDDTRIEQGIPILQPGSKSPSNSVNFNPACAWHSESVIRSGSTISICNAACIASRSGAVQLASCTGQNLIAAEVQARTRTAMTAVAQTLKPGFVVDTTTLPATSFQSASVTMCDGDVNHEFSISQFHLPINTNMDVTIFAQPRFSDQRCASPAVAPKVCYDTNRAVGLHGLLGDSNFRVCANEFILSSTVNTNGYNTVDASLPALEGDLIDIDFGVQPNSRGCPSQLSSDADLSAMCAVPSNRLCLQPECP